MRKFPKPFRLKGGDANTLSGGPQKHCVRILLVAPVVILGLIVMVACASGSDRAPVTAVPTPVAGTTPAAAATPTATPAAGITPAAAATPTATPAAGITPAAAATPTATPALAIQPTTVPTTIPPTSPPGSVPSPTPVPTPTPSQPNGNMVTVWIQVTDSCEQALSGATFTVRGPGIDTTTSSTSGGNPVTIGTTGGCPTQQGNCVATSTGCTTITLNIPSSGTATYEIIVAGTAPGFGTNASYAICQGGSDCPHGPEVATVLVSAGGSVSATTLNIYPDGVPVTWPTNKSAYSGAQSDPVLFHEFGIAAQSTPNNQCDGDYDADDYLTGGRGIHCDSDKGSPGS